MGNVGAINEGEIQVMSAGTGVQHSEYNKNPGQTHQFAPTLGNAQCSERSAAL
jgi:redox-sensitive bicupin YhaK (pirin superfamily)